MVRNFTADEFRQIAYAFEPLGVVVRIHNGIVEREIFARDIVAMLRHAADMMEREEREKKYEYAVKFADGTISMMHEEVHAEGDCLLPLVRREVGKWEEVK